METNLHNPIYSYRVSNNEIIHWKHGVPSEIEEVGLYVFIFRDLIPWIKSFFAYQYHIQRINDFNKFLTSPFKLGKAQKDFFTKQPINIYDKGKTIFDIRYYKMYHYLNFSLTHPSILINLKWLQLNPKVFLYLLNEFPFVKLKDNLITQFNHTKSNSSKMNEEHNVDLSIDMIENQIDQKYEKFISELDYLIL